MTELGNRVQDIRPSTKRISCNAGTELAVSMLKRGV